MTVHSRTNSRRAIVVASALALFGCNGDATQPDLFNLQVNGLVLEYTDGTRTATRPVLDLTWVFVILPDGETGQVCDDTGCLTVNFVASALTFTDTLDNSAGHYSIDIGSSFECTLRVRAWELAGAGNGVFTYSGKTATAPRLASPSDCKDRTILENGPTLIIE